MEMNFLLEFSLFWAALFDKLPQIIVDVEPADIADHLHE